MDSLLSNLSGPLIENLVGPGLNSQVEASVSISDSVSGVIQGLLLTAIIFVLIVTSIVVYYIWNEQDEVKRNKIKDTFFVLFGYNSLLTIIILTLGYLLIPTIIYTINKVDTFLAASSIKSSSGVITDVLPGLLKLIKGKG
jgi:hypothetical protein